MKALLAAAAVLTTIIALPGAANAEAPAGTSYAAAASVTPGAGINPVVTTSGALDELLGFMSPVFDDVVTPLTQSLGSLSSTVVNNLVAEVTGTQFTASSPSTPQRAPRHGFPNCTTGTWTSADCYGPLVPAVSDDPLVEASSGTVQGYAAANGYGTSSGAETSDLDLSVLGVDLGDLGVASSRSRCVTSTQVCTATTSVAGLSLLDGAVAAQTGSDGLLQVSIEGAPFVDASALDGPTAVTDGDISATVQAQGDEAQVSVSLTLDDLLGALGIADTLDQDYAADAGSTITLTVDLGTGSTTDSSGVTAWGLDVGIGLSADIELSVFGLVNIEVSFDDTSTTGDLADVQLGYTSAGAAVAGTQDPSSGEPPVLT